jgi:proteasome activator subunit 3 (PA28 gamma)
LSECEEAFHGTRVFVVHGMLKSNQQLVDIFEKVKPKIWLLILKCDMTKMWVQLLTPRIDDGNDFGVYIQEKTVTELRMLRAASHLNQFLDIMLQEPNQFSK